MKEVEIAFSAIFAKLNALKKSLNSEQLAIYEQSISDSKKKIIATLNEPGEELLKIVEQFYN